MRIAVFSPIGIKDGIAVYSESLFGEIAKEHDVTFLSSRDYADFTPRSSLKHVACWDKGGNSVEDILTTVSELAPDVVHLQLHESYLQLNATAKLIETLVKGNCRTFITAHVVKALGYDLALIAPTLKKVQKVFALSNSDNAYLRKAGINSEYRLLGMDNYQLLEKTKLKPKLGLDEFSPIIATHGLVNSNKGLIEVAKAISLIKKEHPNVVWLALNAVSKSQNISIQLAAELEKLIQTLNLTNNVYWERSFIENNQVVTQLLSLADIGVIPYKDVGESASAAARRFINANIPSLAANIPQLNELGNVFTVINSTDEFSIAANALKLFKDETEQTRQRAAMRELLARSSWKSLADSHIAEYQRALVEAR